MSKKKSTTTAKITPKLREQFSARLTTLLDKDASKAKVTAFKQTFAAKSGLSAPQVNALHAWVTIRG